MYGLYRKDDFVQSNDDIYISRIEFLEDADSNDDIYISRIESLEDAENKRRLLYINKIDEKQ